MQTGVMDYLGSSIFLRNDGIERAEYKNFSDREINAP